MSKRTIVNYYGERDANRCGYCKGSQCKISYGIFNFTLFL